MRWREDGAGGAPVFGEARLAPGEVAVGPFHVRLGTDAEGDAVLLEPSLALGGDRALHVDSVVVGLRWRCESSDVLRFLRHGWQSWSFTGARELDEAGEPAFPSGPWLRGMMHALGAPPPDRAGWHESDLLTALVAGTGRDAGACALGVLEDGREFGVVYARREPDGVRLEAELLLERSFAPGETRALSPVRAALGADPHALLEAHADEHGRRAQARTAAPFRSGWCTWYHFFHEVGEDDVLRNLEALVAARDELPMEVVQIDDGYQRAIGDWLEPAPRFPRGIAPLAEAIRAAGFEAGIWTAPFCVVPESRLFEAHPEWLLRDEEGLFRGLLHPVWSPGASVHVLDPTLDAVRDHLVELFRTLVDMGFTYQKLDFLFAAGMQAQAHDARLTRAERLRRGLDAIRAGAGPDAFLLGCGCPQGAAVGVVDAMRIGPDVAPSWAVADSVPIPGLEETRPSTRNALRSILNRAWMHRRLWLNDPDCLMTRSEDTALAPDEARTLAAAVAVTGGLAIVSDDVPRLGAASRSLVRDTLALARRVDAGGPTGTARAVDFLAGEMPTAVTARTPGGGVLAAFDTDDAPRVVEADLAALGLPDGAAVPALGTSKPAALAERRVRFELAPHSSGVLEVRAGRLAVFCDMDGTLIDRDVGATLAQRYAGERRPATWARFERGEISAWEYNLEVLDGLTVPEAALEAFLRDIRLDPGAEALVRWCEARDVPFRVLSDGFDRNIERLIQLTGLSYAYEANRLQVRDGTWRIEAAFPNPACTCGTGTCKAGRIDALRAERPDAVVVHVGNGRVSDLCGALAADVAFAKDSLAAEMRRLGARHEAFTTLNDVVRVLDQLFR